MDKNLFRCPKCDRGKLTKVADDRDARCASCDARWPLSDGVLDLAPNIASHRSIAQAAMESEAIVRIYESRFWRRSAVFALVTGIDFDHEMELIFREARAGQNAAVLDIACGPGIYTRAFARRLAEGTVVGLDLSRPMLSTAVHLAREAHLSNVSFVRADAQHLPFDAERFDVVNCCGALHLFPDVGAALAEVRRVLAPGGRFTVAAVRGRSGRLAETAYRASGVRPFSVEGLRDRLGDAGLEDVHVAHVKRVWMIASASKPLRSA